MILNKNITFSVFLFYEISQPFLRSERTIHNMLRETAKS
jgi:hypothetical protein